VKSSAIYTPNAYEVIFYSTYKMYDHDLACDKIKKNSKGAISQLNHRPNLTSVRAFRLLNALE